LKISVLSRRVWGEVESRDGNWVATGSKSLQVPPPTEVVFYDFGA
jgi:hypothetical protein